MVFFSLHSEGFLGEGVSNSELMVKSLHHQRDLEEEKEEKKESQISQFDDMNSPYLLKNWCLAPFHPVSSSTSSSNGHFIRRQARDGFAGGYYENPSSTKFSDLPYEIIGEFLTFLGDAQDQARAELASPSFRMSSRFVRNTRFICRLKNVQRACPGANAKHVIPFKDIVMGKIKSFKCLEKLRLEIEEGMQASRFKDEVIVKNSLWLSEEKFVLEWLPPVSKTLQSLTVIDYGQQAIFNQTPLLHHLSNYCKQLKVLELRNMYLNCTPKQECGTAADQGKGTRLPGVTTLTLRCVKLTENGLKDLNEFMPNLRTLTLVTVVGLKDARFKSDTLEVLCLGLATKVKSVKLVVNSLIKLQLKMACPDDLSVEACNLQCLAVCMDKRCDTSVKFKGVNKLRELLMGASEFSTLHILCSSNPELEKVFLDVPCMAFEENGGWKGMLSHVPLTLPNMKYIRGKCQKLHTLSVGPGLWYSLEHDMKNNPDVFAPTWPVLRTLILHLIVQEIAVSMKLLRALVESIPTLVTLEVYVHRDSKAELEEFGQLRESFPTVELKLDYWKKGLKFECFSF
ncbi:hypothetical protein R1flu_020030 [Riccia fluitans]|uniref:Uncharacterized protein n=1 Tax=Riccia fluitans TaxID=41844 RepID=A0ABD1ZKB8_9MARC